MIIKQDIIDLFATIDSKDTDGFAAYLTENVVFIFGNFPPSNGLQSVKMTVSGFFESIRALKHNIENVWESGNSVIISGQVEYTRHSGTVLRAPFCDICRYDGAKIYDYRIYIDVSMLYTE